MIRITEIVNSIFLIENPVVIRFLKIIRVQQNLFWKSIKRLNARNFTFLKV